MTRADDEKRIAAEAAAQLVEDGMTVGLGTGSTVSHLLPALAERNLDIRCVATSPATEEQGQGLGLRIESFDGLEALPSLDIAIDGTDQVAPDGWLVKGGGGAHLREKIVAAAAARFVVIADSSKDVDAIHGPIPLELRPFGLAATLEHLRALGDPQLRDAPESPDGGVIADLHGDVEDVGKLAHLLTVVPGLSDHGVFPGTMVNDVIVATGGSVAHRILAP